MAISMAKPIFRGNINTPCPQSSDTRKITHEYRVETQWIHVTPATGIIVAICDTYTVTFDCRQDRSNWCNAMQNGLVGLGAYRTTSSVPDELTDITASTDASWIIEWEKESDGVTPIKTRPPVHRLAN